MGVVKGDTRGLDYGSYGAGGWGLRLWIKL